MKEVKILLDDKPVYLSSLYYMIVFRDYVKLVFENKEYDINIKSFENISYIKDYLLFLKENGRNYSCYVNDNRVISDRKEYNYEDYILLQFDLNCENDLKINRADYIKQSNLQKIKDNVREF